MRGIQIDKLITAEGGRSLKTYLNELDSSQRISPEEEVMLAGKIRAGDKAALDKLTRANLLFVVSCAKKYQNKGLPLGDLIAEGNLGLIRAAQLYDESKGFKFISYAVWWIRQSIMMSLSYDSRTIRLPENIVRGGIEARRIAEQLEQQLQRPPTDEEILQQLYLPGAEAALEHAFKGGVSSLDCAVSEESGSELWSMLPDPNAEGADQGMFLEGRTRQVKGLLSVLKERERQILWLYFGFSDGLPRTIEDIGEQLGVGSERVRQLKARALQVLRRKVAGRQQEYI